SDEVTVPVRVMNEQVDVARQSVSKPHPRKRGASCQVRRNSGLAVAHELEDSVGHHAPVEASRQCSPRRAASPELLCRATMPSAPELAPGAGEDVATFLESAPAT